MAIRIILVLTLASAPLSGATSPTAQSAVPCGTVATNPPFAPLPAWMNPLSPGETHGVYVEPSKTLIRQTIQVAAGKSVHYNFGLPKGTVLTAEFHVRGGANDRVNVWLLDGLNFQRFVAGQEFQYFTGTSGYVKDFGRYTFHVTSTNIYHVVVDNRKAWMLPREVQLYVYARYSTPLPELAEQERQLNAQYEMLKKLFVFQDFRISLRRCGVENAFSDPNITMCMELIESLGEQNQAQAITFVFFHELGHTLLRLWDYPGYDNEDTADEFATVMLIMGKQQAAALQAAQWWASQTSEREALAKIWMDDRHSISPQRARNIVRWLDLEEDLVRRWYRVLIPNMQTDLLLNEARKPSDPRMDKDLVTAELRKRGCTSQ